MKKYLLSLLLVVATTIGVSAQMVDPVKWTFSQKLTSDTEGVVTMTATIDAGWHLYDMTVDPSVGPQPLQFFWDKLQGVKLKGKPKANKAAQHAFDEMFGAELSWFTGSVTITQKFTVTADDYAIEGAVKFGACNDQNCMAPTTKGFNFTGHTTLPTAQAKEDQAEDTAEVQETVAADSAAVDSVALPVQTAAAAGFGGFTTDPSSNPLWQPVEYTEGTVSSDSTSLWYIFIACFLAGFVALLTPCVWPMIPLTVSFFLKTGKTRGKSVRDAVTYGLSIIIIYLLLGLFVTVVFGASSLNALSTNKWVNLVFFALLVIFAISFFGAFDIKLPEKWSNKIDSKAEKTTGLVSIFFMAFTLTLVSFSCTGPIIGTLLVEAAGTGDMMGPAVGMFGFSLALAIPFCLFAMFPSMLSSLPSSGGWMNTVKVILGFIELALSLKFLSVADLSCGWRILDREVFIVLWIVIFALLGMYLLGKFNFSHYGDAEPSVGVGRFFMAMASFSFAIYLVPGLWGAPLKSVSAFVPPLFTQDFNLYGGQLREYDNFEEGMAVAEREGKPLLIDFSGYGCVNCRKMEAAVLDNADVKNKIDENFVVVKLMVDEKRDLPEVITVSENGQEVKLRTYGDYWSYLQRYKFNANAQPYYVILDRDASLISGPFVYEENIPGFMQFLDRGIERYNNK